MKAPGKLLEPLKPENLHAQYEMARLMAGISADLGRAYASWLGHMAMHPVTPLKGGAGFAADCLDISHDVLLRLAGNEVATRKPINGDRRFKSEAWEKRIPFMVLRRGYEAYAAAVLRMVEETPGVTEDTRDKVRFHTAQFLEALAPANFLLTNPEALGHGVRSKGRSVLTGLKNLWKDIDFTHGRLNLSMSDLGAFEVGENLAVTPGQVVYRNELIELIQYTPTTAKVAKRPLLVIPPWLNKYYVLDLQQENSFIRYLVEQGQTVFLISWRNPDGTTRDWAFDDYLTEGALKAMEVVQEITGEEELNALGYCLGGILLACMLAWLEAKGRRPVNSATYLTTLIDYSDVGDIKVFVDDAQLKRLQRMGKRRGYIPGDNVAWGFRMLRAPDLIWSFVVNHYLLGQERVPFDLLYWNEDATNMPLAAHMFFMKNMYIENRLREPGGIELAGEAIDVTSIETPSYVVATREDHIAPWKTCYQATQLFGGSNRFVLGYSGHIAGVINPPTRTKYGYKVASKNPADPEAWFEQASEHLGSWWPDYSRWLKRHSGGQVKARAPGSPGRPPIEPAPGTYVRARIRPK